MVHFLWHTQGAFIFIVGSERRPIPDTEKNAHPEGVFYLRGWDLRPAGGHGSTPLLPSSSSTIEDATA